MKTELKLTQDQQNIKGIDKLAALHGAAVKIKEGCKSIEVSDDVSLNEANNRIKNAKKIKKQVQDLRKEMTAPLDDAKKQIMSVEKKILEPLEEGISYGSSLIVSYNERLEAERKAELKRLEEEQRKKDITRSKLEECENSAYEAIDSSSDLKELNKVFSTFVKNKKETASLQSFRADEDFSFLADQINALEERIRKYGKAKKEAIEAGEKLDESLKARLEEEAKNTAIASVDSDEIRKSAEMKVLSSAKTVGVRKTVKYKLVDITKVPEHFTRVILDEEEVKEFIKGNKAMMEFPNTTSIPGIEIYEELSHSGR